MSDNMAFVSGVAQVGMLLRNSEYKEQASYQQVLDRLKSVASINGDNDKEEFKYLVGLLAREEKSEETQ